MNILPVLALIFVTLKLTGYIAWSWFWVLAPVWGPFLVAAVLACILWFFCRGKFRSVSRIGFRRVRRF